jgi:hypothetical protein
LLACQAPTQQQIKQVCHQAGNQIQADHSSKVLLAIL